MVNNRETLTRQPGSITLQRFMMAHQFTFGWRDPSAATLTEIPVEEVRADQIFVPGYSETLNDRAIFLDIQSLFAFMEQPEKIPSQWWLLGKRILFQGTRLKKQGILDQVGFFEFNGNDWKIGTNSYDGQWSIGAYAAVLPRE